jgi:hypothetical protein
MKLCIEQVEGGFSVYQDGGAMPEAMSQGMPKAMPEGLGQGSQGGMGGNMAEAGNGGQVVATVEEALQLAGSMLSGGEMADPAAEEASAEALFQSGYKSAAKQ